MEAKRPTTYLTERQADILVKYERGLTPPEIAKLLGMTRQGVHYHLDRLRARGYLETRP